MQHLSQIAPRFCTLVLFIIIVCQFLLLITSNDYNNIEANYDNVVVLFLIKTIIYNNLTFCI